MMMPLFAAFFPLPSGLNWWAVGGTLALGTLGLSTLGTLFAAMTVSLRAREVIFPLLLLPLMVPVIISTAQALGQILLKDLAAAGPWIRLVGVSDMIFLIASLWVFDFLLED
jgi:heme exporter protein B